MESRETISKMLNMSLIKKIEIVGSKLFFLKEKHNQLFKSQMTQRQQLKSIKFSVLSRADIDYFLKRYFSCKKIYEITRTKSLGNCYTIMHQFSINTNLNFDYEIFFMFTLIPFNYKIKKHQFIMTQDDMACFFIILYTMFQLFKKNKKKILF